MAPVGHKYFLSLAWWDAWTELILADLSRIAQGGQNNDNAWVHKPYKKYRVHLWNDEAAVLLSYVIIYKSLQLYRQIVCKS